MLCHCALRLNSFLHSKRRAATHTDFLQGESRLPDYMEVLLISFVFRNKATANNNNTIFWYRQWNMSPFVSDDKF